MYKQADEYVVRGLLTGKCPCQVFLLDIAGDVIYNTRVMERIVEQSLLYDFYGDLLTAHQKDLYEGYVLENLSLAELAEISGISRQGVHDLIRRVEASLEEYERKLHLVEKFLTVKEEVQKIRESDSLEQTREIADRILEIL